MNLNESIVEDAAPEWFGDPLVHRSGGRVSRCGVHEPRSEPRTGPKFSALRLVFHGHKTTPNRHLRRFGWMNVI